MPTTTRRADSNDFEKVRELIDQLTATILDSNPDTARQPGAKPLTRLDYDRWVEDADKVFEPTVAIDDNGKIVGFGLFVIIKQNSPHFLDTISVDISERIVDERERQKNVGSALLAKAEEFARKKNATCLQVGTISNLKANCFYRKHFKGGRPRQIIYSKSI